QVRLPLLRVLVLGVFGEVAVGARLHQLLGQLVVELVLQECEFRQDFVTELAFDLAHLKPRLVAPAFAFRNPPAGKKSGGEGGIPIRRVVGLCTLSSLLSPNPFVYLTLAAITCFRRRLYEGGLRNQIMRK